MVVDHIKLKFYMVLDVRGRVEEKQDPTSYLQRGKPDASFALFESESLKRPGFVEFDDGNGKVHNSELTQVSRTEFMTLLAFIFLYENQLS
ncbi:hypothetical protein LguiA_023891 [Lonicera macranthoides]